MMLKRRLIGMAGVFIAIGHAAPSAAGPAPTCELTIEINALRGGSPTVSVGGTKDITAKARIAKETAAPGTTIATTLRIDAVDGSVVFQSNSSFPVLLEVGKGGDGRKLTMDISQCNSGAIDFVATFFGDADNGARCEATQTIRKTCN